MARALFARTGLKEAKLQNPVLTDRNSIRGYGWWVSKHIFAKPLTNKLLEVDAAGIGRRNRRLPEEIFYPTG